MDSDPSLHALTRELNATLSLETSSLEAAYEKWKAGQTELFEQKRLLDEEAKAVEDAEAALHRDREQFERQVEEEWGPLPQPDRRIRLNVGGQHFETTARILCKDRFSLLAALCSAVVAEHPPSSTGSAAVANRLRAAWLRPDSDVIFVDRDWWLFRHILAFLRAGPSALPRDLELLRQLYIESAFFRLNTLRAAIENQLHTMHVGPDALALSDSRHQSEEPKGYLDGSEHDEDAADNDDEQDVGPLHRLRHLQRALDSSNGEGGEKLPHRFGGALGDLQAAAARLATRELDLAGKHLPTEVPPSGTRPDNFNAELLPLLRAMETRRQRSRDDGDGTMMGLGLPFEGEEEGRHSGWWSRRAGSAPSPVGDDWDVRHTL